MGLMTPLRRGGVSSTVPGTTTSEFLDFGKDADGFPLMRLDGKGNLYLRGGVRKLNQT